MIHIIGGGPAGTFAASNLGKTHHVRVYEEHKEIGLPVQCTGLLTANIGSLVELRKPVVVNKIWGAHIYAPDGKSLHVKFSKPNLVVDRHRFDQLLAKKAEQAGAEIQCSRKFLGCKEGKLLLRKTDERRDYELALKKGDIIIGADGPLSPVGKAFGLYSERELWATEQVIIENKDIKEIIYHPYLEKTAWAVPAGNGLVRVGFAKSLGSKARLDDYAKQFKGKRLFRQGGLIPMYSPKIRAQAEVNGIKAYLVGDAAPQMKNTTGGAIIPSMQAARILAGSINQGKDYEAAWKKALGRELGFHYRLRKAMNRFSYTDWNKLIELCNNGKVKKVMESTSRDDVKNLIPRTLMAEPRLLLFAGKFF